MSDISELFTPASDPKHLTFSAFLAKEETNLTNAVAALPAAIKPFVSQAAASLGSLGAAVTTVGGTALGELISQELPTAEAWFAGLLTKAGASAATPAGQTAIQQIGSAAVAVIQHLTTQASSGISATATAVQAAAQ